MKIIDAHIHIFSEVNGANINGSVKGCGLGRIENAGEISAFIPPISAETSFPVELLLEYMWQNEVCRAVIFQNPTIGSVNDEVGRAILKYPDKLAGVMQVDPFGEDARRQAETLIEKYPFKAVKFEVSTGWGWTGIHSDKEFHYEMLMPLIELARQNGLAVVFDTGDTASRAYLPDELSALAVRFPDVTFVIEHGGYLTSGGDVRKWEAMTDIARKDNVYLGICAIPTLLESEYPCREAGEILRVLYEKIGADKLIWGTDAPCTFKNYTYRQLIDWAAKRTDFLGEEELDQIFYGNAMKVYFD